MPDPVSTLFCLVVAISDGDTMKVRCEQQLQQPAQTLTVRLAEIDAPEKGQPYATRSRAHLAALCFGRPATISIQTRDRYGRSVARVACGDTDANGAQVAAGYAWAYTQYLSDPAIRRLEGQAKDAHRGLWSDENPVAPWEWRKARRSQ
jgi:micrococcal nuclease